MPNGRSPVDVTRGCFCFLFGLVAGQQERRFTNMRMAFRASAGVLNGTFLIARGAIWDHVELPPRAEKVARLSALYGTYGNWLFTTLGARWAPPQPTRSCRRAITESHGRKGLRGWAFAASPIDPCRRGADPVGSWLSANSAGHSRDSARYDDLPCHPIRR